MNTATTHPLTNALALAGVGLVIINTPTGPTKDKEGWKHYAWTIQLTCDGRVSSLIPYRMGTAHVIKAKASWMNDKPKAPRAEDVISSMALDSSACNESFDDWCATFGYDTDSRKALETYLACQSSGAELRKLLGKHFGAVVEAAQEW